MLQENFHADFDCEVIDDVVVIYDLDKGNRSVTNDAEFVINYLSREITDVRNKQVIYRDSLGRFDEILINAQGKFAGFYSINETVLEKAINTVKSYLERKWIIQRCINAFKNEYENWLGYCEKLMSRYEMMAALDECNKKWPEYEFRGHVVEHLR